MGILIKIKRELYYDNEGYKVKEEIEKNRQDIGLCDREQERSKLIYSKKNNVNQFILRKSRFGIVSWGDNLFSEKMIKKLFIDTGVTIDKL